MGYALLLSGAFTHEPQWSPLVFVDPAECEAWAKKFYETRQTIESWSVEEVPDVGKWRLVNGALSIVSGGRGEPRQEETGSAFTGDAVMAVPKQNQREVEQK